MVFCRLISLIIDFHLSSDIFTKENLSNIFNISFVFLFVIHEHFTVNPIINIYSPYINTALLKIVLPVLNNKSILLITRIQKIRLVELPTKTLPTKSIIINQKKFRYFYNGNIISMYSNVKLNFRT